MKKNRDIQMARFLTGEMNVNEEIAFRNEFEGDPRLIAELNQMEKTWRYFDENPSKRNGNSGKAWDSLHKKLAEDGLLGTPSVGTLNRSILPSFRIAASILLIMAIGIPALYFGIIRNKDHRNLESHHAEKGVSTVNLPDGSTVYLNKGAEISYPPAFNQERAVKLKGEAFFEVMSDPVNPFTVNSGKVVISVLGTSFNIKKYNHSPDVEVYVETGKVRMAEQNSGKFITLESGELGHSGNENLTRSVQKDPNYISWKTKDFKFVDEELLDVLVQLEESYHVRIHADKAELKNMMITTSYSEQSIDAILETIGTAFGLSVNRKEDGYHLTN